LPDSGRLWKYAAKFNDRRIPTAETATTGTGKKRSRTQKGIPSAARRSFKLTLLTSDCCQLFNDATSADTNNILSGSLYLSLRPSDFSLRSVLHLINMQNVLNHDSDRSSHLTGKGIFFLISAYGPWRLLCRSKLGGSVAEWLACWTQAQKGPDSNRSHDAVG